MFKLPNGHLQSKFVPNRVFVKQDGYACKDTRQRTNQRRLANINGIISNKDHKQLDGISELVISAMLILTQGNLVRKCHRLSTF